MGYSQPHLSVYDTTTQTISSSNTPQVITFNNVIKADKIIATSTSRFTMNESGEYIVVATAQITAGAANKTADIWIRVNGNDVVASNSKKTIINNEVNFIPIGGQVISVNAGQYVEFWFSGDDTSVSLIGYNSGSTPTRPLTPSIDLTIQRIHY